MMEIDHSMYPVIFKFTEAWFTATDVEQELGVTSFAISPLNVGKQVQEGLQF